MNKNLQKCKETKCFFLNANLILTYSLQQIYTEDYLSLEIFLYNRELFEFPTQVINLLWSINRINRLIDIAPLIGVETISTVKEVDSAIGLCKELTIKSIDAANSI